MLPVEVLLINDGSFLLRMLARRLTERGHTAWLTDVPEQGLEVLRLHQVDLVVLMLAETDAERLAVLPRIKEIADEANLIIVSSSEFLPVEALEADFDDCLTLPCSPAKLWRRLAVFLEDPGFDRQREFLLHPANYRLVQGLLTNLQEIQQNLMAEGADLQVLADIMSHHLSPDLAANLENVQQINHQSTFLVENLLANLTGHDFFQDQVDCYDL